MCGTVRTQLLENAASFLGSQQDVITQFQAALASNLTVVRMFGHGVATGFYLQNPAAMGTYNEQAFRAFDYVLDQAARHQLKLVISFADNWDTDSNSDNKCARAPTSALGIPAFLGRPSGSWALQVVSQRVRPVNHLGKGARAFMHHASVAIARGGSWCPPGAHRALPHCVSCVPIRLSS